MKLATIKRIYDELNAAQFANVLTRPYFYATRNDREYASYVACDPLPSEIFFHTRAIKGYWARSLVYHEMIHQYIEEFLQVTEREHHGPTFWKNYRKFAPKNILLFEHL